MIGQSRTYLSTRLISQAIRIREKELNLFHESLTESGQTHHSLPTLAADCAAAATNNTRGHATPATATATRAANALSSPAADH